MAIILVDETHTNDGDGDGWADQVGAGGARNDFAAAVNAAAAGDEVYVRALSTSHSSSITITVNGADDRDNPVKVFGVKAATTNTTPVQSDLVPGLRTGDTTPAYDQTSGNAAPRLVSTTLVQFSGYIYIYGIKLATANDLRYGLFDSDFMFEECELELTSTGIQYAGGSSTSAEFRLVFSRCKLNFSGNNTSHDLQLRYGKVSYLSCEWAFTGTQPQHLFDAFGGRSCFIRVDGCDLSAYTGTLVDSNTMTTNVMLQFRNTKLNASVTKVSGTVSDRYRVEFFATEEDGTAKTSGESRRLFEIEAFNGTIENDTSFTRDGGASDGASGSFSRKMTPVADKTRDNFLALEGPEEFVWVQGDGTSKTMTVYIANSGAGDYQDDEVWVEVFYPSEAGGAQHDRATTQMQLLGTAANIADDTTSDWNGDGAGSNNAQKFEVSIAPDYEGPLYWRMMFAKNFAASPESLYYDPKVDIA